MGEYGTINSDSSSYESASSSSTIHLLHKGKNRESDNNDDLIALLKYLIDNQNIKNTKYNNIKSAEVILTGKNNYKVWSDSMGMVLRLNHVENYVKEEIVKKVKISEISQAELENYLEIPETRNYRYARNVTQEMADENEYAKYLINKNISADIKESIDFSSSTAFEIWKTLERSYNPQDKEQKQNLRDKLENLHFKKEDNISLFISDMNNTFKMLENLGENITDDEKFDYLFKSLSSSLRVATGIINHQDSWEDCTNHLIKTLPRIKSIENRSNQPRYREASYNNTYGFKNRNKNKNNSINKPKVTCQICAKSGHSAKECFYFINSKQKNKTRKNMKYYKGKPRKVAENVEESENNSNNDYDVFVDDYDISDSEVNLVSTKSPRRNPKNFW